MNQSLFQNSVCKALSLLAIATVSILSTGCTSMTSLTHQDVPVESSPNGMYSVEMHPTLGSAKQYKGALDGTTTVAKALKDSGAVKKFRAMDVEILRIVEHKGKSRGLRMPVDYNASSKRPSPEQDYALLDGDRIIVRPVASGSLLKMISNVAGGPK